MDVVNGLYHDHPRDTDVLYEFFFFILQIKANISERMLSISSV